MENDWSMVPPDIYLEPSDPGFADENRIWQGIPSIERTKKGRLWSAFYGGGRREGKGNYIMVVKSDDNGLTWTKPVLVVKHSREEIRNFDPCLWIDPLGALRLFFSQTAGLYDGRMGVWSVLLKDPDGVELNWEKPVRLMNGDMLNKPTVLSTGEWLYPVALFICDKPEEERGLENEMHSNVYASEDNGKSFYLRGFADVPNRHYDEHSIIELKDKRLWMLVRTYYGIGQSFSHDRGYTWTLGEDSNIKGPDSRFFITRLKSGNILLVNHHNFIRRDNLTAMISTDEGKTWQGNLLLDGRKSVSYPNGVEGENGDIYVVYDRERGVEREIIMAVFNESDILSGVEKPRSRVIVNKGARS